MALRKLRADSYQVDFFLGSYRFAKNFNDEREAKQFNVLVEAKFPNTNKSIKDGVELYLANVSRRKSAKSQAIDLYILRRLRYYIENHNKDPSIDLIRAHHVENFRSEIEATGMTAASINRYFNTVKHFFRKCDEWGFLSDIPTKYLRSISEKPKVREPWSRAEIVLVRRYLRRNDRKIFDFIRLTGCRLSQAIELRVHQINIAQGYVSITSRKGPEAREKAYFIPLSDYLAQCLKKITYGKKPNDLVFLDTGDIPYTAARIGKRFHRLLQMKKLQSRTGNDLSGKEISLHGLRHTFATRLNEMKVPLNDIRLLLGHSSTKVTEGYLHSNIGNLRRYVNKIGR